MQDMDVSSSTAERKESLHTGWTRRSLGYVAVLVLVNVMVDSVIQSPTFVLPQLSDAFDTNQFAWLDSSALLAGATWAPLLGKCADNYGKRKVLVITLIVGGLGGVVCLFAPHISVFVVGRVLQGAAITSMFLSVAIIRDLCAPRFAMVVTGIVTSGSAVIGSVFPWVLEYTNDVFGWQFVFVLSTVFAGVAALSVRLVIPESGSRTPGRVDVAGALALGGGLAGVLAYVSLGQEFGWLGIVPLVLLVAGVVALSVWYFVLSRVPEPAIDVRSISKVLGLALLVAVMGAGAYRSLLQLFSLLLDVSPEDGLGYGIAAPGALGLMFGVPSAGIMLGGMAAGRLGIRMGPAWPLAAGIAVGTGASVLLYAAGADSLATAAVCSFMLSVSAGLMVTSGFNLASTLAPPERQGNVSSMIMMMISLGPVIMAFVGSAILGANETVVDGDTVNTLTGVHTYIAVAGCVFVLAAVPMYFLLRRTRNHAVPELPVEAVHGRPSSPDPNRSGA